MEEIVNNFKISLWKYYALFMMILNKSRYVNVVARNHHLPQWDQLTLLPFISVMRIRNKKLFSWMGVINAAAHWSSSGGNMPVLFGQKVTRDTMVQKLSKLVSPKECERRTIDTLSKQVFVKGSWDNTQFYRQTIRCAKINPLAFVDIITTAWAKLKKLDLVKTRFAAKEREKRKQEISEEIYDYVKGNVDGADTDTTIEALRRLGINE